MRCGLLFNRGSLWVGDEFGARWTVLIATVVGVVPTAGLRRGVVPWTCVREPGDPTRHTRGPHTTWRRPATGPR